MTITTANIRYSREKPRQMPHRIIVNSPSLRLEKINGEHGSLALYEAKVKRGFMFSRYLFIKMGERRITGLADVEGLKLTTFEQGIVVKYNQASNHGELFSISYHLGEALDKKVAELIRERYIDTFVGSLLRRFESKNVKI